MASNKLLPKMPIPSWLLAASETHRHRLDFLSTASFGGICGAHLWLSDLDGHSGYKFYELISCERECVTLGLRRRGRILLQNGGITFLIVHRMLTEHLFFFVGWTPFIVSNAWSSTINTLWLLFVTIWVSFMWVAFSTDDTFGFSLTISGRVSEILAVITLPDRN